MSEVGVWVCVRSIERAMHGARVTPWNWPVQNEMRCNWHFYGFLIFFSLQQHHQQLNQEQVNETREKETKEQSFHQKERESEKNLNTVQNSNKKKKKNKRRNIVVTM